MILKWNSYLSTRSFPLGSGICVWMFKCFFIALGSLKWFVNLWRLACQVNLFIIRITLLYWTDIFIYYIGLWNLIGLLWLVIIRVAVFNFLWYSVSFACLAVKIIVLWWVAWRTRLVYNFCASGCIYVYTWNEVNVRLQSFIQ